MFHLVDQEIEMTKKRQTSKDAADKVVKNIRRKARQTHSSEDKVRIVLAGLRGEESISLLCRREGLITNLLNPKVPLFFLSSSVQTKGSSVCR